MTDLATATGSGSEAPVRDGDGAVREPGHRGRDRLVVLGGLLVSRLFYWGIGVRFDAHFIDAALQVADRDLLTHQLLPTVWYFHLQPPLFNLILGVGFNLFGSWAGLGFQLVYLAATVAIALNLLALLRGVGLSSRWSVVATLLVVVSPSLVEFENELFYVHLEILLLVVAARCLQRWTVNEERRALAGFAAALTALALTRSLYHPLWFVGLGVIAALVTSGRSRKALLLALCAPLVAGLLVATKNQVVFGWFTTGTLEGLNLHRVTEPHLSAAERKALVADGVVTAVSTDPFSCADAPRRFPDAGPYGEAEVLSRRTRKALPQYRFPNLDQRSSVPCLRRLQSESVGILEHRPVVLARSVGEAVPIFFYPTTPDARSGTANKSALRTPGRIEAALLGSAGGPPSPYSPSFGSWLPGHTEWLLVVAEPLGLLAAVALTLRRRRDRASAPGAAFPAFLAWALFTTLVLTQLTEVGENNRFRLTTVPLLLVALVAGRDLMRPWRGHRRRHGRSRPSSPATSPTAG